MDQFFTKLAEQTAAIRAAPYPFALAVLIVAGAIWFLVNWAYSAVLGSKNAQLELADRQLADYKQKLNGATPDEAKARIEALERTIYTVAGGRWEPLSTEEAERLAARLSQIKPRFLNIIYENQLGKDLAQSMLEAFKKARWPEVFVSPGLGFGPGLNVGYGSGTALKIKSAIESTTRLRPRLQQPNEDDRPGNTYIIGVGINQN